MMAFKYAKKKKKKKKKYTESDGHQICAKAQDDEYYPVLSIIVAFAVHLHVL